MFSPFPRREGGRGVRFALPLFLALSLPLITVAADAPSLPPTVAKDAKLTEIYAAHCWFEGPSWDPQTHKLYFTSYTKKNQQMLRLDAPGKVTVWWDHTEDINGSWIARDGRLLCAQCMAHKILSVKIGANGPEDVKVLYEDPKLSQPNDVREAPNGDIYFTDPDFEKKTGAVYLLKPGGKATKIITEMSLPNGIIVSLDGKTLYAGDSGQKNWRAYPIKDDGTVGEGTVFFKPDTAAKGDPDGMSLDEEGNLYCTGLGGVWFLKPEGNGFASPACLIPIKELASNVAFGGDDGKTLFVTCGDKAYSIQMTVRGALWKLLPDLFNKK
jgi:gluconolactonase